MLYPDLRVAAGMILDSNPFHNRLIAKLPERERRAFLACGQIVTLPIDEVVASARKPSRYAWFPSTCVISQIDESDKGLLEVALVGAEGMVGMGLGLGVRVSFASGTVQAEGEALRVPEATFRKAMARSERLRRIIGAYTFVQMTQVARAASCNRFHLVSQRFARWLLMMSDRVRSRRFRMTHKFLAAMLGVRRAGITAAAADLQSRGLIRYSRGTLEILDREGLERVACQCYRHSIELYRELLD